jgi:hypothetical protein
MAHTITTTNPSITWDEFIASTDISVLSDYPECSGKTLDQITEEGVQSQVERQKNLGLISAERNQQTGQYEFVWTSAVHAEVAKLSRADASELGHGVKVLDTDGNETQGPNGQTLYYTPLGYLQHLFGQRTNG